MRRNVRQRQGQPGRPPKSVEEARSRRTVTFLTEGEYKKLEAIARRNSLSISATAHHLLVQSISAWEGPGSEYEPD